MKNTRILITTYQSAFLKPGGGEVELNNLVEILRQLGLHADVYGSHSLMIDAYDIVLHFSILRESYEFIRNIKELGKRVILWPNIWWSSDPDHADRNFAAEFFRLADAVIFKSESEFRNVSKYVPFDNIRHNIVPWHIDKRFLEPVDKNFFPEMYDLDNYILWVGVIEKAKNQLLAIDVMQDFDIPLVLVGYHRDHEYFEACRANSTEKVKFLPFMPQGSDILRSAYQSCSVYLEISSDPPGLSALEAALYERPMVLSRNAWTEEIFGDSVALVCPNDKSEIAAAIEVALEGGYQYDNKNYIISKHLASESMSPLVDLINSLMEEG